MVNNRERLFISVIIISYDSEKTLSRAVECVLKNDYGDNFEIILIDDASRTRVENYIGINQKITVIRNESNKGPAYSRNVGARKAKGDVLFFIDSDISIRPDALSRINDAFGKNGAKALIGQYDTACPHQDFFSNYYNLRTIKAGSDLRGNFCNTAAYAIKKDIFDVLGGFDVKFTKASVEDLEFGRRVFSSGHKVLLYDGLTVIHDKKLTLKRLLKNDFSRASDRVEFVVGFKAIKRIIKDCRFDHHDMGQLFAIFIVPFFWTSLIVGFVNNSYYIAPVIFLTLLLCLNRRLFFFLFKQKGSRFCLKGMGFYLIDLTAVFLGIAAGLIVNLVKKGHVRLGLGYLPFIKHLFIKKNLAEATFFVTNRCNAACRYCFYSHELNVEKRELSLPEIDKIFLSIGPLLRVLFSGGEPFLREDLPAIVKAICTHSKVRHITIPTNGIMTDRITASVEEMLAYCAEDAVINITLNLGELYDERDRLTGVEGSFDRTVDTYFKLKKLKERFSHLIVGVNITITASNIRHAEQIYRFAKDELKVDTLVFSLVRNSPIPEEERFTDLSVYKKLTRNARNNACQARFPFWRVFVERRSRVYEYVAKLYEEKRYLLPCFAGAIRIVITPDGDVFPCETLMLTGSQDYCLGNVREHHYDIKQILMNGRRTEVRRHIKEDRCYCRHECDLLSNISFNPRFLFTIK